MWIRTSAPAQHRGWLPHINAPAEINASHPVARLLLATIPVIIGATLLVRRIVRAVHRSSLPETSEP
jgi:hypothetical protein